MTKRPRVPGTRMRRTLFVLPPIPDDASEDVKDALAVRNACATEGRCPCCGAVGAVVADAEFALVFHLVFEHESGCVVLAGGGAAT